MAILNAMGTLKSNVKDDKGDFCVSKKDDTNGTKCIIITISLPTNNPIFPLDCLYPREGRPVSLLQSLHTAQYTRRRPSGRFLELKAVQLQQMTAYVQLDLRA